MKSVYMAGVLGTQKYFLTQVVYKPYIKPTRYYSQTDIKPTVLTSTYVGYKVKYLHQREVGEMVIEEVKEVS